MQIRSNSKDRLELNFGALASNRSGSNRSERRVSIRNEERIKEKEKQAKKIQKEKSLKDEELLMAKVLDEYMNQQAVKDSRKQREKENPLFRVVGQIENGQNFDKFKSGKKKLIKNSIWHNPGKLARIMDGKRGTLQG